MPKKHPLEYLPRPGQLARYYPWWRSGFHQVDLAAANGYKFTIAGATQEPVFKNNLNKPIQITELRIHTLPNTNAAEPRLSLLSLKIRSDRLLDIVDKYLPATTYSTDEDLCVHGEHLSAVVRLPVPYLLTYGHSFMMDFITLWSLNDTNLTIDVAMRGKDPRNKSPIVLEKRLDYTISVPPLTNTLAFDDDRDAPVRDILVEDFVITIPTDYREVVVGVQDFLYWLGVVFRPPQGPMWAPEATFDWAGVIYPATMLFSLAENIGSTTAAGAYLPVIRHQPKVPYILEPGDSIFIDGESQGVVPGTIIGVTARGIQEV
jgi:hypothetical protein